MNVGNLLTIGGVAMPAPATYEVKLSDADSSNSTRNAKAQLRRDRIRAGIYALTVGYQNIKKTDLKTITTAIAPDKISVTFYDATKSNFTTRDMYVGDRTAKLSLFANKADGETRWDLNFSLIEY